MPKSKTEPTQWEKLQANMAEKAMAMVNAEIECVASKRDLADAEQALRKAQERAERAEASFQSAFSDLSYAKHKLHESKGGAL